MSQESPERATCDTCPAWKHARGGVGQCRAETPRHRTVSRGAKGSAEGDVIEGQFVEMRAHEWCMKHPMNARHMLPFYQVGPAVQVSQAVAEEPTAAVETQPQPAEEATADAKQGAKKAAKGVGGKAQ